MKTRDIKIGTQLKLGFIFTMLLVVVLGLVSYFQSNELSTRTDILYNHPLKVQRAVCTMKSDIIALHRDMKDLSRVKDEKDIKVELDWIKWWVKDANDQISILYSRYLGPRSDLDTLKKHFELLKKVCDETISIVISGDPGEAFLRTKTFGIVGYKVEAVLEKLQVVTNFAQNKGDEMFTQSVEIKRSLEIQLIIIVSIILLFSFIINFILFRDINKPIKDLLNATLSFKKGNMNAHCDYNSKNEFGKLSESFNEMVKLIKFQSEEREKRAEELGIIKGRAQQNESILEELRQANEELFLAKEKAEESDRLKTAFLQNMSHEIRTPMNAIMGFSSLLPEAYNNREDLLQYSNIIQQRCNYLLDIINDILDISKIEAGQANVTIDNCNLNELFVELGSFFVDYQRRIQKHGIELKLHPMADNSKSIIKTDKSKLKQILINLISNAIKFTDSGSVVCSCKYENKKIVFQVSDTGIGIPEDKFDFIFQRFTQLKHQSSFSVGGTGLGLPIVKALTNLLGGDVWLESECGKGTTFFFNLNYIPGGDVNKKVFTEEEYFKTKIQDKTILIVEDDEYNSLYLREILKNHFTNIFYVYNGNDAIQFVQNNPVDIILMDIRLPDISGYEASKEIMKNNPSIKIIAQTAYASQEEYQRALKNSCVDYISKPTMKEQLLSVLSKHLREYNKDIL